MRQWVKIITCDRCGKEIRNNPMRMVAEYVARDNDEPVTAKMPEQIKQGLLKDCTRDYCEDCMIEIMNFAHMNIDAKTFIQDKREEEQEKQEVKADPKEPEEDPKKAVEESKEPEAPKAAEEPKKEPEEIKRLKPDQREKIEQLYARGLDAGRISKMTGINKRTVNEAIIKVVKAG